MAGIIDGEGSIYIRSQSGRWILGYPVVVVVNTNPRLIDWIQSRFGGSLSKTDPSVTNRRRKTLMQLSWTSKSMTPILEGILPYLVIKRDQAEVALAARKLVGQSGDNPLSEEVKSKKETLAEVMHFLNNQDETKNEEAIV